MNYIFGLFICLSITVALINGTTEELIEGMLSGCNLAVKVAFSLIGIMGFWLGIMRIAEKAGIVNFLSKLIYPILKFLFKDIKKDSTTLGDISLSIGANALGLTNAATPIGLKVMKDLQKNNPNKEIATDSMCMFLAMNTAGFQIIPITVIAVLVGLGATNPTSIILPTLLVTTLTFIISIVIAIIFRIIYRKGGKQC